MKRLIEEDFPLREVSKESVREKNIRRGHISTLHIWWARRPLAASRATSFAALIPAPPNHDELRKKLEFVAKLSKWENSLNQRLIENARKEIRDFFKDKPPRVLDCFAGGGAIPFEVLRLGCETHALEYNPVAVLVLKAMLEYPQHFGKGKTKVGRGLSSVSNPLMEDIKEWGNWALEEAKEEIGKFYPLDSDGSIPVGYIWARTVKCQNPSCGVEIPLMRQFWLARKGNRKIALKMLVNKKDKKIDFKIVRGKEIDFDPSQGTTRRATVLCPICGAGIDGKVVRKEAGKGRMGQRLIALILHNPKTTGKIHRISDEHDFKVFNQSEQYLEEKVKNWKWNFNPIPDETLDPHSMKQRTMWLYGMPRWGDLFNARQKLAMITFVEKVRVAFEEMIKDNYDRNYAKVITTYLALAIDKLSANLCSLSRYRSDNESIERALDRQAFPMIWDYGEVNPFGGSRGDWNKIIHDILEVLEQVFLIESHPGYVNLGTATRLSYPDGFFDAVITDPPYYDNVNYAELADFFYVWLKRTVGDLHPDLFSTPLTPKSQEIVMNPTRHTDPQEAKFFFESMMTQSFKEIYRVLSPDGIAVIVFAYKSTDAWETIINSLLRANLILTASWPILTEMSTRIRAKETASLISSIYMVCRKRTEEKVAYFNEIKEEIENRIKEKLTQFWEQGISGADFFVSAIGPAVEVFGKYNRVEKLSGEEVSVQELLEHVRKVVSEFALERVLKRADLGGVDAETRFYLLWRWTFGNTKVHFDDAIKLSRPMGVELTQLWDGGGFVKKEKEFIRVLDPKERAKDPAFLRKTKFTSMIDVLHYVVILWEHGEREKIKEILNETGYAGNEIFWQTAQAISEVLPQGDKEKQLLQGFLYGKEVYVKEAQGKTSLLDYMERR